MNTIGKGRRKPAPSFPGACWITVLVVLAAPVLFAETPGVPARHLVWTHSATDLEALARAALPVKFEIGGGWTGLSLVVDEATQFRAGDGRLQLHLRGHTEPLSIPVDTDLTVRLRFDRSKGVHVVELESMPVAIGAYGKIDLARAIGPWEISPDQLHVLPLNGSAGLGVKTTIRALQLSEDGLRAEVEVHYFRPPGE